MPLSTNISVISWRSLLLAEEAGVPGETHRPAASQCQTISHNVVSSTPRHEWASNSTTTLVVVGTDCVGSCKSNYHTITTMMIPQLHCHERDWNSQLVVVTTTCTCSCIVNSTLIRSQPVTP